MNQISSWPGVTVFNMSMGIQLTGLRKRFATNPKFHHVSWTFPNQLHFSQAVSHLLKMVVGMLGFPQCCCAIK
jgi:hypothetical protein